MHHLRPLIYFILVPQVLPWKVPQTGSYSCSKDKNVHDQLRTPDWGVSQSDHPAWPSCPGENPGLGGVEEGRVLLGQVLWNVRFLHFGPQNLLRSPPWHVHQGRGQEVAKLPSAQPALPARPLCRSPVHTALQPRLRASLLGEVGRMGGMRAMRKHLCLQVVL